MITKEAKMADIIHMNYLLVSVINRFGIKLGFEDKTVYQVCEDNNVNIDFFLEIANAFNDKSYFTGNQLKTFSVELIVNYLKKSHDYYNNEKIPLIEKLINKLNWTNSSNSANKKIIKRFFNEYKKELKNHTDNEELIVYPFVEMIEKSLVNNELQADILEKINNYSIEKYAKEHSNIDEKLLDLKNIIIKYLPPPNNFEICNTILSELFKLENDLKDHARIEEQVMIPKVKVMEKKLHNLYSN